LVCARAIGEIYSYRSVRPLRVEHIRKPYAVPSYNIPGYTLKFLKLRLSARDNIDYLLFQRIFQPGEGRT
jgi:hypothetical protein